MSRAGRLRRLARLPRIYAYLAWWGLVAPRTRESGTLVVLQAVIRDARGVLLTVRSDLRGWELPGGNARPGETDSDALRREVREETGLQVAIERHVGDYERSGFRPHVARVYQCRPVAGEPRPSRETPRVRWFDPHAPPDTLFPWYRAPLSDALAEREAPVRTHERQGAGAILAGIWIDLRMRWSDDEAG